ncbi:hypothetical protein LAZ67_2002379, partial [Cordylochernes scorpioides]
MAFWQTCHTFCKMFRCAEIPKEGPTITGSQTRYEEDDLVNVTCVSAPSKPAPTLKWQVNGLDLTRSPQVPEEYLTIHPVRNLTGKLQSSSLGLVFKVEKSHVDRGGGIVLRCTALLSQAYAMTSAEVIIGTQHSVTLTQPAPSRDGLNISGVRAKYRPGDNLNVNCTSSYSKPPPHLQWHVNDIAIKPILKMFKRCTIAVLCWVSQAEEEQLIRYPPERKKNGLEAAVLGLKFLVEKPHFNADELRLRCTETMSRVVDLRSEDRVLGSRATSSGLQASHDTGHSPTYIPLYEKNNRKKNVFSCVKRIYA